MNLHRRLPFAITFVLLAAQVACDKSAGASAPAAEPPTAVAPAAPPAAPAPAVAAPAPVDDIPGGDQDRDPLEDGLDHAWRAEEEGCKPKLDDADRRFATAFQGMCTRALTSLAGCVDSPAMAAKVKDAELSPDSMRQLRAQLRSATAITETCEAVGRDYFCNYQGRTWSNAYSPVQLRVLAEAPAGDCAAVVAVFPAPLYPTGE